MVFTRGLLPHPEDYLRRPVDAMDVLAVHPNGGELTVDAAFVICRDVCWDGSRARHPPKCLNRAAWVVVAFEPHVNTPVATVTLGTQVRFPDTSSC